MQQGREKAEQSVELASNANILSINDYAASVVQQSDMNKNSSVKLERQALRLEELAEQFKKRAANFKIS